MLIKQIPCDMGSTPIQADMKIFLSGEVRTDWRDEIIKTFKQHTFYNPKKKNWSIKDKKNERQAIIESDLVIVRKKKSGKGTKAEIKFCEIIRKRIIICEDNASIIKELREYDEKIRDRRLSWSL